MDLLPRAAPSPATPAGRRWIRLSFMRLARTRCASLLAVGLLALGVPEGLAAQEAGPPAADPADVATVDAIVAALYDVISGPAGEVRNWDRFRSLFRPEARLIPVGRPGGDPEAAPRPFFLTVEDYIEQAGPALEEGGFFEREIGRVEERFGEIVHAFSAYDSRRSADGEVFQRGINSIQLASDGERWWIVNVMWRGVGPEEPLPERYLAAPPR